MTASSVGSTVLGMSRAAVLLLTLALAVVSCKPKPPPEPAAPRTTPIAPGAPHHLAVPDEVRVKLDLSAVRSAVAIFRQESSGFPPSLASLDLKLHYPADLRYDSATGKVSSITYPQY